jgi:5'-nucleotidase
MVTSRREIHYPETTGKTFMRTCGFIAALLFAGFLAPSFSLAVEETPFLVIFHTNDVHGYAPAEKDRNGKLAHIGYDRLKAVVDGERARHKMLVDAGDVLHGQAFATAKKGELVAGVLSVLGYDAIAVGNHEFDYGQERLLELRNRFRLNFVAANIVDKKRGARILPPYVIKDFEDVRVGIFGLTTPSTPVGTDPRNVADLTFGTPEDVVRVAREMVRILREVEKADIVIALTHLGSEFYCNPDAQTIAREAPGIDLVVDGHSHSVLPGLRVNGTLVASAGAFFSHIGKITVERGADGFRLSSRLLRADALEGVAPDPGISLILASLAEELERELGARVAHVPFDLNGERDRIRHGSTNMGRLICAALLRRTGADAAIINSGAIRGSIPAGDVTQGRLLNALPYGNYVYTVRMSGADVLDTINHGLGLPGAGAFPQFYGITVNAREKQIKNRAGAPVTVLVADSVLIGGRALERDASYTIAVNDFLYAGGDGYTLFSKYAHSEFGTLHEVLLDFLSAADSEGMKEIDLAEVLTVAR